MPKKLDVVTIGSALKDIMFYSDDVKVIKGKKLTAAKLLTVEYGAKFDLDELFINYGGGALNVGVGLNNFGLNVAPYVCLGNDKVAEEIFYYLKKQGLKTNLISFTKKSHTGFSMVVTSSGDKEHTIFSYKGATKLLELKNLDKIKTKWFYVAGLSLEKWDQEMKKVTWQAHQQKKICWNPGGKQIKDYKKMLDFLPKIEVLILNNDEALELVKNSFSKVDKRRLKNLKYLLIKLKELGPKNVIITAQKKGCQAVDKDNNFYKLKSEAKKVVDTVGAGDAFASGFLAGFIKYNKFSKGLELGIKNSAAVLRRVGAQNGLLKVVL